MAVLQACSGSNQGWVEGAEAVKPVRTKGRGKDQGRKSSKEEGGGDTY